MLIFNYTSLSIFPKGTIDHISGMFLLINDPGKSLMAKGHGPTQLRHLTGTLTMFQMVQKEHTFVTLIIKGNGSTYV